jgi:hypothetical protein
MLRDKHMANYKCAVGPYLEIGSGLGVLQQQ